MKVWVLCASQGSYSDYSHWVHSVYTTEAMARARMKELFEAAESRHKLEPYWEEIGYDVDAFEVDDPSPPNDDSQ